MVTLTHAEVGQEHHIWYADNVSLGNRVTLGGSVNTLSVDIGVTGVITSAQCYIRFERYDATGDTVSKSPLPQQATFGLFPIGPPIPLRQSGNERIVVTPAATVADVTIYGRDIQTA